MRHVFPYFGGKKRIAPLIWELFADVDSYLEPFGGSLAVALECPFKLKHEVVNDLDGFVCNFWRAVSADPEGVARAADWPVSHLDLTSRHNWLKSKRSELTQLLLSNPNYYDSEIAGVWVWGISAWIGGRWCAPTKDSSKRPELNGRGCHSVGQRPTVKGEGCNSVHQRPDTRAKGVSSVDQRPQVGKPIGSRPHLELGGFYTLYHELSIRLRHTRITCCDWTSLKSTVGVPSTKWGVFLDPPYTEDSGRRVDIYAIDDVHIGHQVAEWARELAERDDVVVAMCGIEGEHEMPGFEAIPWTAAGYTRNEHTKREVLWVAGHQGRQQNALELGI